MTTKIINMVKKKNNLKTKKSQRPREFKMGLFVQNLFQDQMHLNMSKSKKKSQRKKNNKQLKNNNQKNKEKKTKTKQERKSQYSQRKFQQFIFQGVIPNLKKVGLLTETVRPKFEELDLLKWEDFQNSEDIEWIE